MCNEQQLNKVTNGVTNEVTTRITHQTSIAYVRQVYPYDGGPVFTKTNYRVEYGVLDCHPVPQII